MGKKREPHPFEDNPFVDGLLDYMASPEGQRSLEVSDTLWPLMDTVQLDARRRELIWPDDQRLDLDQSIARILQRYPDFPPARVESFLISWLEHYSPKSYSQEQLHELDELTEEWIHDRERQRRP